MVLGKCVSRGDTETRRTATATSNVILSAAKDLHVRLHRRSADRSLTLSDDERLSLLSFSAFSAFSAVPRDTAEPLAVAVRRGSA